MLNAYAFSFPALDGSSISLSSFVGKVLLVVNTASQCVIYSAICRLGRALSEI